jgi:hypothetical protein
LLGHVGKSLGVWAFDVIASTCPRVCSSRSCQRGSCEGTNGCYGKLRPNSSIEEAVLGSAKFRPELATTTPAAGRAMVSKLRVRRLCVRRDQDRIGPDVERLSNVGHQIARLQRAYPVIPTMFADEVTIFPYQCFLFGGAQYGLGIPSDPVVVGAYHYVNTSGDSTRTLSIRS